MTDSPTPLPDKRQVARELLVRGSVFVHLDPRRDGVAVPAWLRKQPQLVLQIGLDMAVPIPDLNVDGDGIVGTLSFNRSPFTCVVPWDAVFAMAGDDGRGMVWPDSMPTEILAEVEREAGRQPPPALALAYEDEPFEDDGAEPEEHHDNVVSIASRRPKPRLVPAPAEASSEDDAPDDDPDDEPEPPEPAPERPPVQRGHLRLLK